MLSTPVNRTYNRTNRGLIRITLGHFKCIRESRTRFLKLKKPAQMSRPCVIVQAVVQDRERTCDTVWGGVFTTVHEIHSTSGLNRVNIVYKSYGIVRDRSQVLHPTSGEHTRFHTSAIRPIRFKYESFMVQCCYLHGLTRPRTI